MTLVDNIIETNTTYATEIAEFEPTPAMSKAKSTFWSNASHLDKDAVVNFTLAMQLCGTATLKNWWSLPGFQEWFSGRNEWNNRVQYLAMCGLDVAEQLLHDRRTTPASKVQLIKLFAELADKVPSKAKEIRYVDAGIANMDAKQLDDYISKNTKLIAGEAEEMTNAS